LILEDFQNQPLLFFASAKTRSTLCLYRISDLAYIPPERLEKEFHVILPVFDVEHVSTGFLLMQGRFSFPYLLLSYLCACVRHCIFVAKVMERGAARLKKKMSMIKASRQENLEAHSTAPMPRVRALCGDTDFVEEIFEIRGTGGANTSNILPKPYLLGSTGRSPHTLWRLSCAICEL
jgi:hypothetical protein